MEGFNQRHVGLQMFDQKFLSNNFFQVQLHVKWFLTIFKCASLYPWRCSFTQRVFAEDLELINCVRFEVGLSIIGGRGVQHWVHGGVHRKWIVLASRVENAGGYWIAITSGIHHTTHPQLIENDHTWWNELTALLNTKYRLRISAFQYPLLILSDCLTHITAHYPHYLI